MKVKVDRVSLGQTGLMVRATVEGPGGWIRFIAFPLRWGTLEVDDLLAAAETVARMRRDQQPADDPMF